MSVLTRPATRGRDQRHTASRVAGSRGRKNHDTGVAQRIRWEPLRALRKGTTNLDLRDECADETRDAGSRPAACGEQGRWEPTEEEKIRPVRRAARQLGAGVVLQKGTPYLVADIDREREPRGELLGASVALAYEVGVAQRERIRGVRSANTVTGSPLAPVQKSATGKASMVA